MVKIEMVEVEEIIMVEIETIIILVVMMIMMINFLEVKVEVIIDNHQKKI